MLAHYFESHIMCLNYIRCWKVICFSERYSFVCYNRVSYFYVFT